MLLLLLLLVLPAALLAALLLYAILVAPYRPVLRRVEIEVPPDWPRLRILHLSDLHVQAPGMGERLYRTQQRFLRTLPVEPDLVCVSGDLCEEEAAVPRVADLLRLVPARLGTFAVLGNHEHAAPRPAAAAAETESVWGRLAVWAWRLLGSEERSTGDAEAHAIAGELRARGIPVLVNAGVRLEVSGGRTLWLAGVDSAWAGCASAAAAVRGRRPGEPCLGLVHEPEAALPLIGRGAGLVLAGHTHGGQVVLPWIGAPVSFRGDPRIRVAAGLQQLGHSLLHISAGLGHVTPLRFNCPPEATWIECVPVGERAASSTSVTRTAGASEPLPMAREMLRGLLPLLPPGDADPHAHRSPGTPH